MKALRTPIVIVAALCLGYSVFLAYSAPLLPERVAHFGISGQSNIWMSRSEHLLFVGGLGVGLALLFVIFALVMRLIPTRFIYFPHRDFWLAPEHETQTRAFISRRLLWLACLLILFFFGVQYFEIEGNRVTLAHWPVGGFLLIGAFLVGVILWLLAFFRHFTKAA